MNRTPPHRNTPLIPKLVPSELPVDTTDELREFKFPLSRHLVVGINPNVFGSLSRNSAQGCDA
jgi:hypothetical protein